MVAVNSFLQVQNTLDSLEELYISSIAATGKKLRKFFALEDWQQADWRSHADFNDVSVCRLRELLLDGVRKKSVNVHVRRIFETVSRSLNSDPARKGILFDQTRTGC